MGDKARIISDGFLEHYGLKTTVLRHLLESQDHHCAELEVHSRIVDKNLKAVWVGSDEYRPMGTFPAGPYDPFALWLKDKERGSVPEKRVAWERQGWFRQASGWILHQLDRLNIQVTGSVQQIRAGWYSSAVLRVNTAQGFCYFKAAPDVEPREAALTVAVASRWPQWVPEPLAVDVSKNWMLSRNYGAPVSSSRGAEDFSAAARSLAELQIDSLQDLEEFKKLGCPYRKLEDLSEFLGGIDSIFPILTRGRTALSEEELRQFEAVVALMRQHCEQLAGLNLPDMLIHEDFHPRNLYRHENGYWITDWANSYISHPLLSFGKIVNLSGEVVPNEGYRRMAAAYLEPFGIYGPTEPFGEALVMAAKLAKAASLLRRLELLPLLDESSISPGRVARSVRMDCRNLISPASRSV